MHARPVVGGLFIKMLSDPAIWKKWSGRDKTKPGEWAPLPVLPVITNVVPDSEHQPVTWRYTTDQPPPSWIEPAFDDNTWKEGPGGFGTKGTSNIVIGTKWNTDDIWLRRQFTMPQTPGTNLQFYVYHDEDIDIYVNGVLAAHEAGYEPNYETMDINVTARSLLKPGAKITLAVKCHQTKGGQGVDVGLVNVAEP